MSIEKSKNQQVLFLILKIQVLNEDFYYLKII